IHNIFIKCFFIVIPVCNFNQALDLKEGEAKAIFEELISRGSMDEHNSLIQFHFRLLALILGDSKKEKLRSYIQDENARHGKVVKEEKHKIAAAKEKEKCLAQLQNERAKVSSIPMKEDDALIKIRTEVGEAQTEMLRLKSTSEKCQNILVWFDNCFSNVKDKSGCDATRINPMFVDNNGMTFWKVQSYNDECVLLQVNSQNLRVKFF
ncbi:hypothetical protein V8G54_011677, partial [Vigna mungo]